MAKFLVPGIVVVACLAAGYTGATFADHATLPNTQSAAHTVQVPNVTLYQSPNHKAKSKKVSGGNTFVAIYQKGKWLKVGDKNTGDVGWINTKDFHKTAMKYRQDLLKAHHENMSSYDVYEHLNKKTGQPEIVAYKNGKRVSGKEAQALYHKTRLAERAEFKQLQQQVRSMQAQMNAMMQNSFFNNGFGSQPMPQPEVVFVRPHGAASH